MTGFRVYALRRIGDTEIRYVGQTRHPVEHRLSVIRAEECGRFRPEKVFGRWLSDHKDTVEAIVLDEFQTREEALIAERIVIRAFANAGHRLFNRDHVPKALKYPNKGLAA